MYFDNDPYYFFFIRSLCFVKHLTSFFSHAIITDLKMSGSASENDGIEDISFEGCFKPVEEKGFFGSKYFNNPKEWTKWHRPGLFKFIEMKCSDDNLANVPQNEVSKLPNTLIYSMDFCPGYMESQFFFLVRLYYGILVSFLPFICPSICCSPFTQ